MHQLGFRERESWLLCSVLLLSFRCLVTVNLMCPFLVVPWVGLQCVNNVVFPVHTHLLFEVPKVKK